MNLTLGDTTNLSNPVEIHSVHQGINRPQKHHPLYLAKPPLNLQTVQAPVFRQSAPPFYIGFL